MHQKCLIKCLKNLYMIKVSLTNIIMICELIKSDFNACLEYEIQ